MNEPSHPGVRAIEQFAVAFSSFRAVLPNNPVDVNTDKPFPSCGGWPTLLIAPGQHNPLAQGEWFWQRVYMAQTASLLAQEPLVVHTRPVIDLDDDQFFQFCQLNRDLQIERTAEGDIIIMAPEAGSSGRGSSKLNALFDRWAEGDGRGQVFGSSTGFKLPKTRS